MRTWKEHVRVIVPRLARDARFAKFMRDQAMRLKRDYYRGTAGEACSSFKTCETAGFVEVGEDVIAASTDLISVNLGTAFYQGSMAHPNVEGVRNYVWSRRLGRLLKQDDVFAVAPDRKLRRIAQSRFDNQEGLQNPKDADGIPLSWDHASIGPTGITWSFRPYELGGYLSAGDATVSWADLKPYLRRSLPFAIRSIRSAPPEH